MKNSYEERAKRFIDRIIKIVENDPSKFEFSMKVQNAIIHFQKEHPSRKIKITDGATRRVFITSDYVVKVNKRDENYVCGNCETEIAAYEKVKGTSFDHLFAPSIPYGRFEIQPKVTAKEYSEVDWREFVTDEEFCFLTRYFHDLHLGNFTIKKRKPIFFDYACNELPED